MSVKPEEAQVGNPKGPPESLPPGRTHNQILGPEHVFGSEWRGWQSALASRRRQTGRSTSTTWTPLRNRRQRGLAFCPRPIHRTNGHPGQTLTGGTSHEPRAILCRHRLDPEVAGDSVHGSVSDGRRPQRYQFVSRRRPGRREMASGVLTWDNG